MFEPRKCQMFTKQSFAAQNITKIRPSTPADAAAQNHPIHHFFTIAFCRTLRHALLGPIWFTAQPQLQDGTVDASNMFVVVPKT